MREKGEAGYIHSKKIILTLLLVMYAIIIGGLVITGIMLYDTKKNLLSLIAILVCLPACWTLVRFIMFFCHSSINERKEMEIEGVTEYVTVLFDMIITSRRRAMHLDALVVSNNVVCGYTSHKRLDEGYTARYIKEVLKENDIEKVTVKIFHDYKSFITRAEGMNNIAAIESEDRSREYEIKEILLDLAI